jgi:hypothetical protein
MKILGFSDHFTSGAAVIIDGRLSLRNHFLMFVRESRGRIRVRLRHRGAPNASPEKILADIRQSTVALS